MQKTITVSSVESPVGKIVLHEQEAGKQYPTKYSFFQNYPDGNQTQVYTDFLELGVHSGGTYTIEVQETQAINKISGKPVTYRNVKAFLVGSTTGQVATSTPGTPDNGRMDKMAKWAMEMSAEVKKIQGQIGELEAEVAGLKDMMGAAGNPAYEVSKSLDAPIKEKIFEKEVLPTINLDEEGNEVDEPNIEDIANSVPF